jgi:hypothetical protein
MYIGMKRALHAAVALLALSCASSGPQMLRPSMHLVQITGPQQNLYQRGLVLIRYKLYCHNRSSEPITLRQVELRLVSPGGFLPDSTPLPFAQKIAPDTTAIITFHARGYAAGTNAISNQPLTVRVIAYFESPEGNFHHTFLESLDQFEANEGRGR